MRAFVAIVTQAFQRNPALIENAKGIWLYPVDPLAATAIAAGRTPIESVFVWMVPDTVTSATLYDVITNGVKYGNSPGSPVSAAATYPSTILGDGPMAYYQLNDAGSTAKDSSQNGINGTIGAAIITGTGLLPMQFPGIQSAAGAVQVAPTPALRPSNAVSLEVWFEFTTMPSNFTSLVVEGARSGTGTYECYIKNGSLFTQVTLSSGILNLPGPILQTNTMYHAVTTYDGNLLRLYLNGVLVATSSPLPGILSYQTAFGLSIGNDYIFSGPPFTGKIGQVAIYETALTAAQVARHYAAG